MKLLLILAALLPLALCDEGETCTQVIVTGDEIDAECTCTCLCEMDCPATPPPVEMDTTSPDPGVDEMTTFEFVTTTAEPGTEPPPIDGCCVAGLSGQDLLDTYDGNQFQFLTNNKFVMSDGGSGPDQCKFQVRVDTDTDDNGQHFVSWAGVAFGVHHGNESRFDRNFRLSLRRDPVEIRGRGFSSPGGAMEGFDYNSGPFPLPWNFQYVINADGCFVVTGGVPDLGCDFEVTFCEKQGPTGRDYIKIRPPDMYIGSLMGMCGNFDGNPADDDQHCPRMTGDISDDCIEGRHQNNDAFDS